MLATAVLVLGGLVGAGAGPAAGTSPGGNGLLVLVRNGDLYTASPVTGKIVDRLTFGGSRLGSGGKRSLRPRWSPDGTRIAFLRDRRLHVMNADGTGTHRVFTGERAFYPSWSPDGKWLAYSTAFGDVFKVRVDNSGPPVRIIPATVPGEPECFYSNQSWSPTGPLVAFTRTCLGGEQGTLVVVNSNTRAVRVVATPVAGDQLDQPSWRPDGKSLLFVTGCGRLGPCHDPFTAIGEVNLDGTGWHLLTDFGRIHQGPVSSPDGTQLAFVDFGGTLLTTFVVDRQHVVRSSVVGEQVDWQPVVS